MWTSKRTVWMCLVLSLALMLSACSGIGTGVKPVPDGSTEMPRILPATNTIPEESLEDHILIAQNNAYSLYVNAEYLSVIVKENATGKYMTSAVAEVDENDSMMWRNFTKSGVDIEYYAGESTNTLRADMVLKKPTKEIIRTNDGFAAHIRYAELGISFTLIVSLNEDGITAQIPAASIEETGNNKLASAYVFPFMGYTFRGERDGYMLIPDGCGAVIDLVDHNEKYNQPYTAWIYADDWGVTEPAVTIQSYGNLSSTLKEENVVSAPIFGMVHRDTAFAFLGIVEGGQYNAKIQAYPNGVVTQYNWISAQFIYRQRYIQLVSQSSGIPKIQEERASFDARVRFIFTSGEDADYSGLAKEYREYLLNVGRLSESAGDYRMRTDFFGGDLEEAAIGKRYVAMTTLDQMQKITDRLAEKGIENPLIVYRAWQAGGCFGDLDTDGKLASQLGSKKQLQNLLEAGMDIHLYADVLHLYSTPTQKENVIYRLNEQLLSAKTGQDLYPKKYFCTPTRAAELLKALGDMPLAVDGVTKRLYSFRQGDYMISRKQCAGIIGEALETGNTAMYTPFDYQWQYTDEYLDFPMYSSNYRFVTQEVPFLSMVLGGSMSLYSEYVNFQANRQAYLLRLVEMGVYPSFLLTWEPSSELMYTDSKNLYTTQYETYLDLMQSWNEQLSDVYEVARGGVVHHEVQGQTAISTYANGAVVYVNYGLQPETVHGITVPAQSFYVRAGGEAA